MEYSAGLTSKLFWLQEARKTASYIADGLSKSEIRAINKQRWKKTLSFILSIR